MVVISVEEYVKLVEALRGIPEYSRIHFEHINLAHKLILEHEVGVPLQIFIFRFLFDNLLHF